jgi:uncharacterized protein
VRLSVIRNNEVVGQVQIDKARTLGQGATAEIFAVDFDGRACAAKIYLDPSAFNEAKILSMLGNPPGGLYTSLHGRNYPLFAWPEAILSDSGKAVGFLMPAIDPNHAFPLDFYFDKTLFNRLGSPSEAALSYRLEIAANLSSLIAGLHGQGHHFIDIKPQNIRVLRGIHVVTLVDCDGFSICSLSGARYPAELMSTDYVAPEAFRSHASPGSLGEQQDRYALAVILFQLLNGGTHPFQGILGDPRAQAATNDEKAAAGLYPHGLAINPLIAPRPSSTHACWLESTRVLFDRAFIGGEENRPSASDWSEHFNELLSTKALVRCDVRPNDLGHMCFRDKPCAGCLSEAASSSAPAPLPAFTRAPAVSPPASPPQPVAGDTQGDLATLIVVTLGILIGIAAIIFLSTAAPGTRRESSVPASSLGSQVSEGATSQGMPGAGPSFGVSTPAPAQSTDTLDTAAGAAQTAVEPEDIAWAAYSRGDYATALSLWRSLADQGDASAQSSLGFMYGNGVGVPENDVEAVKWYRQAADQGFLGGQYNLGVMYAKGEGVPENDAEAVRWFLLAAGQGDASAQENLGRMYAKGEGVTQNDGEAVRWYRLAADQGLASAQSNLGLMYANGKGVPKNDAEAVRWFRLAADQGLARAQYNLGFMYDNGEGVQQNDVAAVRWYRLAAAQGDASAQSNLGLMYSNGEGVRENDVEAVRLYRLAAEQGDATAQYNLGNMYANGEGVPENDVEAVRWFRLAADQGLAIAQFNLAFMYDNGEGVQQNDVEAVRWYRLAADRGDAMAQTRLGYMYQYGEGAPEDDAEAARWFRLGAEQGNAFAQSSLGIMYELGEGVPKNDVEAARLYSLAADQGHGPAQYSLGFMYAYGKGVSQNSVEAYKWYSLAAAQSVANAERNRDFVRGRMTPAQIAEAERLAAEWQKRE